MNRNLVCDLQTSAHCNDLSASYGGDGTVQQTCLSTEISISNIKHSKKQFYTSLQNSQYEKEVTLHKYQ